MTNATLGPVLSQKNPLLRPGGPSSINDCWVVASIQGARAVGGRYTGAGHVVIDGMAVPTIPTFRSAAGKPDVSGIAGAGGLADMERGVNRLYPDLHTFSTPAWATFVSLARKGGSFALIVDSSKLPSDFQFGFKGIHAVSGECLIRTSGEAWYFANPLQTQGDNAMHLSLASMHAAFMGALLIKAPAPVPAPVPPPVVPAPPPADPTPFSQEDLDKAVADAKFSVKQAALNAINNLNIGG